MASAAGMLAPIPAMFLLAKETGEFVPPNWWQLYLWSFAIAYLGVNFAVPLRRQYVVIEKLRFPTGTTNGSGDPIVTKGNVGDGYIQGAELSYAFDITENTELYVKLQDMLMKQIKGTVPTKIKITPG